MDLISHFKYSHLLFTQLRQQMTCFRLNCISVVVSLVVVHVFVVH